MNSRTYNWKHWLTLCWILNPAMVINELLLGQRIPKITLLDQTIDKSITERTFVPCPHCQVRHHGQTWSAKNGTAFKNWFGLYCPNCGKIIPCVINVFSFIILALTFPIWGCFRKKLKNQWLKRQPERFRHITMENSPKLLNQNYWLKTGLIWGGGMFFIFILVPMLLFGEDITAKKAFGGLLIFMIAGLLVGLIMKLFVNIIKKYQENS